MQRRAISSRAASSLSGVGAALLIWLFGSYSGADERSARATASFSAAPQCVVGGEELRFEMTSPEALAIGDFDQDGVPDLLSSYRTSNGFQVFLSRGNEAAIYSSTEGASDTFLAPSMVFSGELAPDYLETGDFDGDGYLDALLARRGDRGLWLYPGDGDGGFRSARTIALEGQVAVVGVGEIDRKDGLVDVVVGVASSAGTKLLVFESASGALNTHPESIQWDAPPNALAFGHLDEDSFLDVAIAADAAVKVLHGRDNKLPPASHVRAGRSVTVLDDLPIDGQPVASIATGRFFGDEGVGEDLALVTADGRLLVATYERSSGRWRRIGERIVCSSCSEDVIALSARVPGVAQESLVVVGSGEVQLQVLSDARSPIASCVWSLSSQYERPVGVVVGAVTARLNGDASSDLVLLMEDSPSPVVALSESAAVIDVNGTTDAGPVGGDGVCQLSEAIVNANTDRERSGGDCAPGTGADTIRFSVTTIDVTATLPSMTDPGDVIDGSTGCGAPPCVELRGNGTPGPGVAVAASGVTVRGLIVSGFGSDYSLDEGGITIIGGSSSVIEGNIVRDHANGAGVLVKNSSANLVGGAAAAARNTLVENLAGVVIRGAPGVGAENRVLGNYIGSDGTVALRNTVVGVEVVDATLTEIGGIEAGAGNLISGNGGPNAGDPGVGVLVRTTLAGASDATLIQGNVVGLDASGTAILSNRTGIEIRDASYSILGGSIPTARNVISGNDVSGVLFDVDLFSVAESDGNLVQGNLIGTDIAGTAGRANAGGIKMGGLHGVVGGLLPGEGNVVSGNQGHGIELSGGFGHRVEGNLIGTDASGVLDIGNSGDGVRVSSTNSTIGGSVSGARNVISGNDQNGVAVTYNNGENEILGNYIGTDLTGSAPVANSASGIQLLANENTVGGVATEMQNVIAFNSEAGIWVTGVKNGLLGNTIHSNGLIGIDLCVPGSCSGGPAEDGVTANDVDDLDSGGNEGQNFPVLTAASATSGPDVTLAGTLDGRSGSVQNYRIEFFANRACDPAGNGEGARFLGAIDEASNEAGDLGFNVTLPAAVENGEAIVATATVVGTTTGGWRSTSEFGACLAVSCSELTTFEEMVVASSKETFSWATPTDIRFAKGPISGLASYLVTETAVVEQAFSLDTSTDVPSAGQGFYYIVRPRVCGSWQAVAGNQPARDGALP